MFAAVVPRRAVLPVSGAWCDCEAEEGWSFCHQSSSVVWLRLLLVSCSHPPWSAPWPTFACRGAFGEAVVSWLRGETAVCPAVDISRRPPPPLGWVVVFSHVAAAGQAVWVAVLYAWQACALPFVKVIHIIILIEDACLLHVPAVDTMPQWRRDMSARLRQAGWWRPVEAAWWSGWFGVVQHLPLAFPSFEPRFIVRHACGAASVCKVMHNSAALQSQLFSIFWTPIRVSRCVFA